MNQKIRCTNPHCRRLFLPHPRVKNQRYCEKKDCQRFRKRRWQCQKMKDDPDYHQNQRDSQQNWIEKNPDYWKRYRSRHPEYVQRNRMLQKERDRKRRLAKMDASREIYPVTAGSYYLIPAKADLAKKDALLQKYILFPASYPFLAKKDSMDFPVPSPYSWAQKEV
jgi:hypothetical protein